MAIGPVSGKEGITLNLPAGKECVWNAFNHAALTQHMKIVDSQGNVVLEQSGNSGTYGQIGFGKFTINSNQPYKIYFSADARNDVKVLWETSPLNVNLNVVAETLTFAVEDSSDDDYNDIFATFTWFAKP